MPSQHLPRSYRVILPPVAGQPCHIDLVATSRAAAILAAQELTQAPIVRVQQQGDW